VGPAAKIKIQGMYSSDFQPNEYDYLINYILDIML
jgi:hypothetical protein